MTISAALRFLARSTFSALFGACSLLAIAVPAQTQVMEIVKDFEAAGTYPMASLTLGADGFLYGTTYKGGSFDEGTVFKVAVNGSNFSVLKSLRCGVATNGCLPLAGLVHALDGYLYGTTSLGGASDEGTVFRIATDGSGFAVLKSFQCGVGGDGCSPQNGLIQTNDGMLYGTAAFGGSGDGGTIFKLAPDGSNFVVLRSLQCGEPTNSCHPAGRLLQASDGFLYGTSYHGGARNQGSVFRIATSGADFALLQSFQCGVAVNGCMPLAGLIQATDGMLYGTTQLGGAVDEGTLFKLATNGSNFAIIRSFQCGQAASGCLPVAGVVQLGDGNLYGTTTFGGANAEGALYRIALDGTNFTVLDRFACDGDDGCKPQAPLTFAGNGYLYSTSSAGGKFGGGTIFRLPAPAAQTKSGPTTLVGLASPSNPTISLSYDGRLRDRVGRAEIALNPDGRLDGVFTVTITSGSGARTITRLQLTNTLGGIWNTQPQDTFWSLGVAADLDGSLINAANDSVSFGVKNGGSFKVFAADFQSRMYLAGTVFTLTATFSDGSTASAKTNVTPAVASNPTILLSYDGRGQDRVGQAESALNPDGKSDGIFTVIFHPEKNGPRVTQLQLTNTLGGVWNTKAPDGYWSLGVANGLDTPLLNMGNDSINLPVSAKSKLKLFAADFEDRMYTSGVTFTLTAQFSDGSSESASTRVP